MAFNYQEKCKDFSLLFFTKILRMFSYGMFSIIFIEYLLFKGLTAQQSSWIQAGAIFGDVLITLLLTTYVDKIGRINTLMLGSLLKLITGLCYAESQNIIVLIISGVFGIISVTGGEIGPFMSIQQSALTHLVEQTSDKNKIALSLSTVFGYYHSLGYISQAIGALFAGFWIKYSEIYFEFDAEESTKNLVRIYAILGGIMFIAYSLVDEQNTVRIKKSTELTIKSQNISTITKLSILSLIDAFGSAFVVQSFLSFYLGTRYEYTYDTIGCLIFAYTIANGISSSLSSYFTNKIGAGATILFTHSPSSIILIVVCFVKIPAINIYLLFASFFLAEMGVPARQAYINNAFSKQQRPAASVFTNAFRSIGLIIGLGLNGYFMGRPATSLQYTYPFLIGGSLKVLYDIWMGLLLLFGKKREDNIKLPTTQLDELSINNRVK